MTDRRSLSGSLNVTAGSGIWDSEGGATVNCVPASAEILYKSHQPNSSIFPNLDWNISYLSITSSVVVLKFWSMHQQLKDNWKDVSRVKRLGAVDGIISIKNHLKGAFGLMESKT